MVFAPPAVLAALMSAIRSETVAALKVEGAVRSSRCSTKRRVLRFAGCGRRLRESPDFIDANKEWNHIVNLLSRAGLRYNAGAGSPAGRLSARGRPGRWDFCLAARATRPF